MGVKCTTSVDKIKLFNRIISFSQNKDGFLSFEEIKEMQADSDDDEDVKIEKAKAALRRWGKKNDTKISREEFLEALSK